MSQDLYARMGKELRVLFKSLKPLDEQRIQHQMEQILQIAGKLGGPLQGEVEKLAPIVQAFLQRPNDPELGINLREKVMRLEQETREI